MKQSIGLKFSQGLSLTPALQQAIKLLQMSTLDLQQEIQDALDGNLMLEREDDLSEDAPRIDEDRTSPSEQNASTEAASDVIPEQPANDFEWDDIYTGSNQRDQQADQALYDFRQANIHAGPDLKTHIQDQLALLDLSDRQALALDHMVDALDARGFLPVQDEWLAELARSVPLKDSELSELLGILQQCDPNGVGARSLQESLLIQLDVLAPCATRALARALIRDHSSQLGEPDAYRKLRDLLPGPRCSENSFSQALAMIRDLNPDPGADFSAHEHNYVAPDVYVQKREGHWLASINPDVAPKLRINTPYQELIKRADNSPDQQLLKQHLQEARYFLHSLKSRNETLLKVAQEIVDQQRGFLEYGPEAMRPLVLRDIAGKLGIHESTVSRTTAHKYMHTPRGLYELKYFFSSAVSTAEGGSCSATAIQAMIRRLVNEENSAKPLSDSRLTQVLIDKGIQVARRTVAKYREGMNIPPSHERKRMA
ncbi:MAG: RNA polymerase factor sigma-54 [Oceanococcus sp.]